MAGAAAATGQLEANDDLMRLCHKDAPRQR